MSRRAYLRDEYGNPLIQEISCRECQITKPVSEYRKTSKIKDDKVVYTYRRECKECSRKIAEEQNKKNSMSGKTREDGLRRRFNIGVEEYDELFRSQDFKCAICKREKKESEANFHVDHDHVTNKVRGILCGQCNRAIGAFKDDWRVVIDALRYLESFRDKNPVENV